jgi:hypothetical protein
MLSIITIQMELYDKEMCTKSAPHRQISKITKMDHRNDLKFLLPTPRVIVMNATEANSEIPLQA